MCDEVELPLALQNHLLQARHLTTQLGEWIPQYLGGKSVFVRNLTSKWKETYAHAWAGRSFSSSGAFSLRPFMPSTGMLARLSSSSSSNTSVSLSSSS